MYFKQFYLPSLGQASYLVGSEQTGEVSCLTYASRGHIEGARHITGAELPARITEVPNDRSVAIICGSR